MRIGVSGKIETFIEEALRSVSVSVNNDGRLMDGAGLGRNTRRAGIVSLSKRTQSSLGCPLAFKEI